MSIKVAKIKKFFLVFLTITVSLLVIYAIYTNKDHFADYNISKYSQVTIDEKTDIIQIIDKYSNTGNKEKFIAELKKVNKIDSLSNDSVYGKTLFVPIIQN